MYHYPAGEYSSMRTKEIQNASLLQEAQAFDGTFASDSLDKYYEEFG